MGPSLRRVCFCTLVAIACHGCAAVPPASAPAASGAPGAPSATPPAPVQAGSATVVVGQNQCCPPQTLPDYLGLTKACQSLGGLLTQLRDQLGKYFPGLEPQPPVLAITDPANKDSPNPAVAAAANIKAQEDAAEQKIKALRYLATIGCGGCYPDVEKAYLSGLADCTEEVRFEAAQAIRKTAGGPCMFCKQMGCCSPEIRKKLADLAFGMNKKTGFPKEPSARVRRAAKLALDACGCPPPPEFGRQGVLPEEGPGKTDVPPEPPAPK